MPIVHMNKHRWNVPTDRYRQVVGFLFSLSSRFSDRVKILSERGADLRIFFGPRPGDSASLEERLADRQAVITALCTVLRDCPDPQVRADAYDVLQSMGVVQP